FRSQSTCPGTSKQMDRRNNPCRPDWHRCAWHSQLSCPTLGFAVASRNGGLAVFACENGRLGEPSLPALGIYDDFLSFLRSIRCLLSNLHVAADGNQPLA